MSVLDDLAAYQVPLTRDDRTPLGKAGRNRPGV